MNVNINLGFVAGVGLAGLAAWLICRDWGGWGLGDGAGGTGGGGADLSTGGAGGGVGDYSTGGEGPADVTTLPTIEVRPWDFSYFTGGAQYWG